MGHLFMFLCELIITLEFLLSTKMVVLQQAYKQLPVKCKDSPEFI